jgi:hypothetical protein
MLGFFQGISIRAGRVSLIDYRDSVADLNCSQSLDHHAGLFPGHFDQGGPSVADRLANSIGTLLPIALCGRPGSQRNSPVFDRQESGVGSEGLTHARTHQTHERLCRLYDATACEPSQASWPSVRYREASRI